MNRHRGDWAVPALFSLLVLAACGGDSADDPFAGPPGGGCGAGALLLPDGSCQPACAAGEHHGGDGRCQPAGLPVDMPCPPGEHALADGRCEPAGVPEEACAAGFVPTGRGGCAPILPDGTCPPGQMAVPGDTACREVAPCGEGPWNASLPEEATTEYVDQRYPGDDSDGSRQRPWKTVMDGIAAAAPGAIVALSAGRYTEDVMVESRAVRLWGLCPARTEVVGAGRSRSTVLVRGAAASGSAVRGLSISGPGYGIAVSRARAVVLEELWIHDAGSYGVVAVDQASATVRRTLVEHNQDIGVFVAGAEATVEATVARATQTDGTEAFVSGISVQDNPVTRERGRLVLTSSLVEDNHELGVFVGGSDATVEATVVRATQPDGTGAFGRGIDVQDNPVTRERARLVLTSSLVEDNHDVGVLVEGSEATVFATIVRATQPDGRGAFGRGIDVRDDETTGERGKLVLTSSLVEDNHDVGVLVEGSEATVFATAVRATQPNGTDAFGAGIAVQADLATGERGKLALTSSRVEDNHHAGVFVGASEATVEATVVRATQPDGTGALGRGIDVQAGPATGERGKLVLASSLVEDNHELGVFVEDSDATIEATVVRATQPDGTGAFGWGIVVQAGLATGERGNLLLTSSLVEDNHDVGVLVAGSDATVEATVVRGTKKAPAGLDFGDGILAMDQRGQSSVTLTATVSSDNARAGVLYVGSTGELSFVRSSGNRYGLVLQSGTSGAHPTLGEGNLFEGNTEKDRITGGVLPVPSAAPPLP